MAYDSTTSPIFLAAVRAWIAASGEILVMIRFSASGGAKSFEFFGSFISFQDRLASLPSRTCVIAFRDKQLPLRGVVDDDFTANALTLLPEGKEWLAAALSRTFAGSASWFDYGEGETKSELREELEARSGESTAFGPYPPWLHDSEAVISAVVPDPDGTVVTGIY